MSTSRKLAIGFVLMCASLLKPFDLCAQEIGQPHIHNYLPKEYKSSPQVFAIAQDALGILYFGLQQGVLQYDGKRWEILKTPSSVMALHSSSRIYAATMDDFGYLHASNKGELTFFSLQSLPNVPSNFWGIKQIASQNDSIFFLSSHTLLIYNQKDNRVVSVYETQKGASFTSLLNMPAGMYVHEDVRGVLRLASNALHPEQGSLANESITSATIAGQNKAWLFSQGHAYQWQPSGKLHAFAHMLKHPVMTSLVLPHQTLVVGTIGSGAIAFDSLGNPRQYWNVHTQLHNNSVFSLHQTAGQLWMGLDNGLAKSENPLAWSIWNHRNGLNGWVEDIIRFEGKLYLAANGVYYLEGATAKPINDIPPGQCWRLWPYTLPNGKQILLAGCENGIYHIKNTEAALMLPLHHVNKFHPMPEWPNKLYAANHESLHILEYVDGKFKHEGKLLGLNTDVREIAETKTGELWLGSFEQGVFRVSVNPQQPMRPHSIQQYGIEKGLPSLRFVYPFIVDGDLVFGTEKGLYTYLAETDSLVPYQHPTIHTQGLDVYRIYETPQDIWMLPSVNQHTQVLRFEKGKGAVRAPQLPYNEFGCFYADSDGSIWLAGSEGAFLYHPMQDWGHNLASFNICIRKLIVGQDSLVLGGYHHLSNTPLPKVRLDYANNSIVALLAAPFFDQEEATMYRWRLRGYNDDWSDWGTEATVTYNNLHEGNYVLEAMAKNIYGKESAPVYLTLSITSPYYRTWWAYLLYALSLGASIYLLIRWNSYRYIKNQMLLNELVKQKTKELETTNRDLMATTEELRLNAEELLSVNERIHEEKAKVEDALNALQKAQNQLVQAEKMASLGLLTAGVAHEINNPINFISGGAQVLENAIKELHEILNIYINLENATTEAQRQIVLKQIMESKHYLESPLEITSEALTMISSIKVGVERVTEIVHGLRSFSRTDTEKLWQASLKEIFSSALLILRNKYKDRIKIVKEYDESLPNIECYPGPLSQVFMNIVGNSIDAISGEGTITISTQNLGEFVRISIKDTGTGIPEDIKAKIFDPFFTTKEVGKGTGLGLSIVHGIIQKHHGTIEVFSEWGKGAEFVILLPKHPIHQSP